MRRAAAQVVPTSRDIQPCLSEGSRNWPPPCPFPARRQMDALRLTFYVSSVACVALLPFHLKLEGKAMAAYRGQAQSSYLGARGRALGLAPSRSRRRCRAEAPSLAHPERAHRPAGCALAPHPPPRAARPLPCPPALPQTAGLVLLTAALALAYNLSHAALVNVTSPTATTVMGELKIVLILLLSAVVLGARLENTRNPPMLVVLAPAAAAAGPAVQACIVAGPAVAASAPAPPPAWHAWIACGPVPASALIT